jgi:plasmid stability protein
MATLTLKNVPDDLYARLKQSAIEHRRSINREAIACLERVLRRRPFDPEAFLADVRVLRRKIGPIQVTDRDINAAKRPGRP